jgi:hypothetical protein
MTEAKPVNMSVQIDYVCCGFAKRSEDRNESFGAYSSLFSP